MKRSGFTMIELIFVIVILGILAAVAIPKLAATRDDAQISKIASNIKTVQSELSAYAVSQGSAPTAAADMREASNVVVENEATGYVAFSNNQLRFKDGSSSDAQICVTIDVNDTHMKVAHGSGTSTICKGVQAIVKDANISIAGRGVQY